LQAGWGLGTARDGVEIRVPDGVATFGVRVVPRASKDAIEGEHGGALKVKVTEPADRANEAPRRLLAARLNVPLSAARIVAGEKSGMKWLAIAGVSEVQIAALCGARLYAGPDPGCEAKRKRS
jgi:uncharacterized protein